MSGKRFPAFPEPPAKRLHRDIVIEKPLPKSKYDHVIAEEADDEEDHDVYPPDFDEPLDYDGEQREDLFRNFLGKASEALEASQQAVKLALNPIPVGIEKVSDVLLFCFFLSFFFYFFEHNTPFFL